MWTDSKGTEGEREKTNLEMTVWGESVWGQNAEMRP